MSLHTLRGLLSVRKPSILVLAALMPFVRLALAELSLSLKAKLQVLIRACTSLIILGFRLVLVVDTLSTERLMKQSCSWRRPSSLMTRVLEGFVS